MFFIFFLKGGIDVEYFRSDNQYIYTNAPYTEFYLPVTYFDPSGNFASDNGQTITTLGIFNVGIFENDKLKEMKLFSVPTWIDLFVEDSEFRDITFEWSDGPIKCKVLKYFKNAKFMSSSVIEEASQLTAFIDVVNSGKVPRCVPYGTQLIDIWWRNQDLNGESLKVPSVILELILSVLSRPRSNKSIKFSTVAGKPDSKVGEFDYMMMRIREICRHTSTFTALTYEDKNAMITTALNRTMDGEPEKDSPVEDIIKM